MSAQGQGPASLNGSHGMSVAGQHLVAKLSTILRAMSLKDLSQLGHGKCSIT
jgi:hypothetical protein